MQKQTFKNALIGIFETFLMMPEAVNRFSSDRQDALKSFIFPLLLYPFVLWSFAETNHTGDPAAFALHAVTSWGGMFLFYAVIYAIARGMKKLEYFWQFLTMANTVYILSFVLLLPIFLTVFFHSTGTTFFQQYWIFYIIADMAFTAFVLTKSLRLNWPLGIFLASINLFFSDVGSQLVQLYLDHGQQLAAFS
jgi:hypothetical protein